MRKTVPAIVDPVILVIGGKLSSKTRQLVSQLRAASTEIVTSASEDRAAEEHALLVASRILEERRAAIEDAERVVKGRRA